MGSGATQEMVGDVPIMAKKNRPEQAEQNYDAFLKLLPELLKEYPGKFVLMRNGERIDIYDTAGDAQTAGQRLYPDDLFSIQEITDSIDDLGYYSCHA